MIRLLPLALVLTLPWPLSTLVPAWVDEVLYNPRERTATAIEAAARGDADQALAAARTAYEIAPRSVPEDAVADPESPEPRPRVDSRVAYNTGTAHLAAGDAGRAVELLNQAAATADADAPGLAATTHYNLGNAQLEAGDTAAAIASYKESLRRDPADAAAKHNLEVALRRLDEERKLQAKEPRETPGGDRPGEREVGDQGGGQGEGEAPDSPTDDRQPGEDGGEGSGGEPPTPPADAGQPPPEDQPRTEPGLRDFEDQPDMTAEQARALLEAVENVERLQRQEAAAERQRKQAAGRKDW